ncbi:tetratricopeptide repeat protein [Streptomyces sp. NPDC020807]|uniref:tetratricopeptide repeat protein n=1 Tax=Streptomyces sp. NPDC020807 TaxID=3155119 RepID=UPI0033CA26E4
MGEGLAASGDRSVAAGGNIGSVVTGDFSTLVEQGVVLPAEALAVPDAGLVHLPDRTALFVGREKELALLDDGPWPGVRVLCGLGGIGKSTLAAHWASGRLDGHHPVWWITAETPAELDAGLAALARAMHPTVVGVLPDDALRERALQWLATHDDWLLILDNVSDPADLRPLLARGVRGRVLVTSRRATGWQDLGRTVALEVLDPEDAAGLFTQVCGSDDGVGELCAELGCLPLALRQAAAYCAEAGITPRAYGELLAAYPAEMFAAVAEGGEEARTVARVWQVTLGRLGDTPRAVLVLHAISWWGPEGIPRRLLEPLGTPVEVTEAVRRLAAHSMITLRGGTLSVHRLVQAVVREHAPAKAEARELAEALLHLGMEKDPDLKVAAHAEALAGYTDPAEDAAEAAFLFQRAGTLFGMHGSFSQARTLLERSWSSLRRVFGPDHEVTLEAGDSLAVACDVLGDPARSVELLEQKLAHQVRALGADDSRTLRTRGRLTEVRVKCEPEQAETLLREYAAYCDGTLGPFDPRTIDARRVLLRSCSPQDVAALEALFSDAARAVPESPDLHDRITDDLVVALLRTGRPERALVLAEAAVESHVGRFGADSPRTLVARGLAIELLMRAGQPERGRDAAAVLLEDCLRVLGEGEVTQLVRRQLLLASGPPPPLPS